MRRQEQLENESIHHVMNKSIAGFKIFHGQTDYERMLHLLRYYSYRTLLPKFSQFLDQSGVKNVGFERHLNELVEEKDRQVQIVAYCLMPTHIHLAIKQLRTSGISKFMSDVLNSYTRYFNTKHQRNGPLWVGKFKNVAVQTDEQLLHLTRYIHLNPTTAKLVRKPEDWEYSSYVEYINPTTAAYPLCNYNELIDMPPKEYTQFTEDNIKLQQELAFNQSTTPK